MIKSNQIQLSSPLSSLLNMSQIFKVKWIKIKICKKMKINNCLIVPKKIILIFKVGKIMQAKWKLW